MSAPPESAAVAAVTHGDRTWFTRYPGVEGSPHSAVTQLIQAVWQSEPAMARAILRRRIRTTAALTPMDRGMVKTAAQRVRELEVVTVEPEWRQLSFVDVYQPIELSALMLEVARDPMALAHRLAGESRREGLLRERDRPVGCVLVGAGGELLAWAHNTNRLNRTLHAEVNLVQAWWAKEARPLPSGSRLYTTLEPCRMCQGMIRHCGPGTAVFYAKADGMPRVPGESPPMVLQPR